MSDTFNTSSGISRCRSEDNIAKAIIANDTAIANLVTKNPELMSVLIAGIKDRFDLAAGSLQIPGSSALPGNLAPPENDQFLSQLDLEIRLLLNAIPIAHEGHIISSEYHNSLRKALLALAERIGLTVKPVSKSQVFTFAPNFLPLAEQNNDVFSWFISFNKAVIPPRAGEGEFASVGGALTVRLPDDATIKSMIVRGARVAGDEQKPDPKSFVISLNRMKFDLDKPITAPTNISSTTVTSTARLAVTSITPLIVFDLSDKKGKIKEENNIENSLPDDLDETTSRNRAADLSRVDNKKYQYFVLAQWQGARGSAQFEIHSLQIFC